MNEINPKSTDDSRAEPIFNGLAGESLQAFVDRRNAEFAGAMNPNVASHLSVQDIANRGSDGRY